MKKDSSIGDCTVIGDKFKGEKNLVIGTSGIIGDKVKIKKDVTIGNYVNIGSKVDIEKGIIGNGVTIGDNVKIKKDVTIGNNAEDLIRAIIDGIRTFKDELISPESLKEYLDKKEKEELSEEGRDLVNRLTDLHSVYVKYQEFWGGKSVIDFNDIIVESINLLKSKPLIQKKLQSKYYRSSLDQKEF